MLPKWERAVLRGRPPPEYLAVRNGDLRTIGSADRARERDGRRGGELMDPDHFAPLYITRQILPFWLSVM